MKVFVVMGNDYPSGAFSSHENAQAHIDRQLEADKKRRDMFPGAGRIYWRIYEYTLDDKTV